ncbi:hypothetical protein [Streptomyces sp. NPDC048002]|uniref:hypothetical protein n=1 Tax=Streptomyces sp. NPDC048002 TaxID=3154344 RepID=UPI0033FF2AB6
MPIIQDRRRVRRTAAAALGAGALLALAAAPAAFGEEAAPELVVGGVGPIDGLKPGGGFDVPVTVANKGTVAAEKVWVSHSVTRGLDYAEVPSNCRVQHVRSYDEMPERWWAVCAFDQAMEPGSVYRLDQPLRVTALDRALYDELGVRASEVDPGADENGETPVQGTAPAVKLVEAQPGSEGSARIVFVPVTTVNTADYQVTGAALKGNVGDTVTMKATFLNAGPAWVKHREGDRSVSVRITLPEGTSVIKRGQFCRAEGEVYVCGMRSHYEGAGETYTFQLKIDKRVAGAKGSVALSSESRPFDPNKDNDRADITLEVADDGTTGSTGGSGGSTGGTSGSTGGSTEGSDGSTGGGGTSGSSGGSSTGGGTGSTADGGDLATTGSSALPLAGVAAAATVVGAATVVIVRRGKASRLG